MELSYRRHQFPPIVIRHAVWLYLRFTLSYRDLADLLAERKLDISYETVRSWVLKFGPVIARRLRRCRPSPERSMALGRDDCSAASECHQIPVSRATGTSDGTQCGISQIRAGRVLSAAPARFCADLAHHRGRIHFCRKPHAPGTIAYMPDPHSSMKCTRRPVGRYSLGNTPAQLPVRLRSMTVV